MSNEERLIRPGSHLVPALNIRCTLLDRGCQEDERDLELDLERKRTRRRKSGRGITMDTHQGAARESSNSVPKYPPISN